jgi:hypothetical protein
VRSASFCRKLTRPLAQLSFWSISRAVLNLGKCRGIGVYMHDRFVEGSNTHWHADGHGDVQVVHRDDARETLDHVNHEAESDVNGI